MPFTPLTTPTAPNGNAPGFTPIAPVATAQPAPTTPKPDVLQKASDIVGSVFPGGKLGKAVGTALAGLKPAAAVLHGDTQPLIDYAKNNPTNIPEVAGDTVTAGATAAFPGVEGVAKNAIIGATTAVGSKIASGDLNPVDLAGAGAVGAGEAAIPASIGKYVAPLLAKLPIRIAQKALAGATPETALDALSKTRFGSIQTLLDDSKAATQSGGKQIQAILSHPDHASKVIEGTPIFNRVIVGNPEIPRSGLPDSGLSQQKLAQVVTQLVPNSSTLVKKLFSGEGLNLSEANSLRQELDSVVKPVYINGAKVDAPAVAATKQVGAEVASALREQVKGNAPETVPMFEKLQHEINLRNALSRTQGKLDKRAPIGLYDILSTLGGLGAGGPIGAAGAYLTEKAARSPAIQLGVAKAAAAAGPGISKGVGAATKAVTAPIIRATNQ